MDAAWNVFSETYDNTNKSWHLKWYFGSIIKGIHITAAEEKKRQTRIKKEKLESDKRETSFKKRRVAAEKEKERLKGIFGLMPQAEEATGKKKLHIYRY